MITVALIGSDGAGKSTLTKLLPSRLPWPTKVVYMNTNPWEPSLARLPTTRAWLRLRLRMLKTREHSAARLPVVVSRPSQRRHVAAVKGVVRLLVQLSEESVHFGLVWYYRRRGYLVLLDRHFLVEYFHDDVRPRELIGLASRIHGFFLERIFPRPDLVVCLDAPGTVLFERKGEFDPSFLEEHRRRYLAARELFPRFVAIDAAQALPAVVRSVVDEIVRTCEQVQSGNELPPARAPETR